MKIRRFFMEDWLSSNRFSVFCNMAESGVLDLRVDELLKLTNTDFSDLEKIKLEDIDARGSLELRSEIAKLYKDCDESNVMVTTGTSEALFCLFNILLCPGDNVIVMFPAFQSLYDVPRAVGAEVRFFGLSFENKFKPKIEDLEKLVDRKTKLIILNSPHNPTGQILDESLIKDIINLAEKNNIKILADEHYRFLSLEKNLGIMPSLRDFDAGIICTGSFIKCFGLMGLRIGWIIADEELLKKCRDYKDYLTHVTPPLSDFLAYRALKNKQHLIKRSKDIVLKNYSSLEKWMENNKIFEWVPAQAGVVSFLKFREECKSDDFCRKLIEEQSVFLLPGTSFEMDGFVRLGFGYSENNVFEQALERISKT
ncbi:aminotransferase class I/II-fold pyridoxal phosphate-dependent enzyme [bacterium]|nr:aminotransferase class I/II-fold pyridoxal phosphate-dependent enzyme [bacterium]